jgi:branched-chain amino acid transport system permease protein
MEFVQVERTTKASRIFGIVAVAVLAVLASLPWWGDPGDMRLIAEMAYYVALAQLWNLLAGYAGLVSVGQQAYVGLGAYVLFYLTGSLGTNVYLALLIAGPFACLISIPVSFAVFRLRGAYFAVGTWVVSEVFALVASLIPVLGGGSGLSLTPVIMSDIAADRAGRDMILYLMSLATAVVVFAIVYLLLRSRSGLALTAIRDSEVASASLGVNTFRTKFIIYLAAAACTALVGGLIFLQKLRLSPEAGFSINDWTVVVIFMVVIGGIGTLEGPFIGMVIYFALRELLADYGTIYLMLMGAIAIAVMLKAPFGIWGWVSQRYDLQLFPVGRRLVLAPSADAPIGQAALPLSFEVLQHRLSQKFRQLREVAVAMIGSDRRRK